MEELEKQLAEALERIRLLEIENKRLIKTLVDISFSASGATLAPKQETYGR